MQEPFTFLPLTDPGWTGEPHAQSRTPDVRGRLPLVEHGLRAAVAFVLFAIILALTLAQLGLRRLQPGTEVGR